MSRILRSLNSKDAVRQLSGCCVAIAVASLLAGCSANVARLDPGGPSLSDNSARAQPPRPSEGLSGRRSAAGGPVEDYNAGWPSSGPRNGSLPPSSYTAPTASSQGVKVTSLPDPVSGAPLSPPRSFANVPPGALSPAVRQPSAVATAPAQKRAIPAGQTIDVAAGDTLYGLSKRHGVSIAALMELNNLQSPNLKPGQKIVLPRGAKAPFAKAQPAGVAAPTSVGATPQRVPATVAGVQAIPQAAVGATAPALIAPTPSPTVAAWAGSYVVKPGESLYGIARAHRTTLTNLQAANGIADPNKVRPGSTLKVPAGIAPAAIAETAPAARAPSPPAAPQTVVAQSPRVVQKPAAPSLQPAAATSPSATAPPTRSAALSPKIINSGGVPTANDSNPPEAEPATAPPAAAPPAAAKSVRTAAVSPAAVGGAGKLRWPVKGKVLAAFGKRPDGTHNDGVNIAVAEGSDVAAADGGSVAYAGSELKGYGNLVLIRHDNGLVTAYAHNNELLVKRGDPVKRGQVIAKAGKSGTVDQPQVHFELRQGSTPVDPTPYMERM